MTNRLFIDIHIIQTVPPSCVNRDDTGSPKTAIYGGVTRARVSSQAWKKAVRDMFKDRYGADEFSLRTKRVQAMVSDELNALGSEGDTMDAAKKVLNAAGLEEKTIAGGKDAPLFFMSKAQARALANQALVDPGDKKAAQKALRSAPGIDLALFGRMVADDANLNIDASCQVAHAISTHKIQSEYDYFTAIDDFPPEDKTDAGAAMIGTIEYNSSTLYRYATIAAHELCLQLGSPQQASRAIGMFTDAFARSMPKGKINTFANQTPPDVIYVAVRSDQPINLVGAFERPVYAGEGGYVKRSVEELVKSANDAEKWAMPPTLSLGVGDLLCGINHIEIIDKFSDLLPRLVAEVEAGLA